MCIWIRYIPDMYMMFDKLHWNKLVLDHTDNNNNNNNNNNHDSNNYYYKHEWIYLLDPCEEILKVKENKRDSVQRSDEMKRKVVNQEEEDTTKNRWLFEIYLLSPE
ncbi:unnamed protein product [Heterobilharzia americana]|nr:unnamed protein product [Heterobilharzia americana]